MLNHNALQAPESQPPLELVSPAQPVQGVVRELPFRDPHQTAATDPLSIAPNPGPDVGTLYIHARDAYSDGMSLALATHRRPYDEITADYLAQQGQEGFSAVEFWDTNFDTPQPDDGQLVAPPGMSLDEYTLAMREKFIHPSEENSTFDIWLPYDRSVAGAGRFSHHSFLWDGYHMAKGYAADGRWDLVLNIVDNTEYQINRFGYGLNGSAGFLATRSQPPYFSHEVSMLADEYGDEALVRYLPAMEKEYAGYWMDGDDHLEELPNDGKVYTHRGLVRLPTGNGTFAYLNRYWDDADGPRLESYKEDAELGEMVVHGLEGEVRERRLQKLYKDVRSGAASGWDFSSRWFEDKSTMATINTTDILPVDLNSLLARTEHMLARANRAAGNMDRAQEYEERLSQRVAAINKFLWNPADNTYRDYNFVRGQQTGVESAAMAYPLYVGIANAQQTFGVAHAIESKLLFPGGVVATTTDESDQQWDGGTLEGDGRKNVWAPLNWASARGLARMAYMLTASRPDLDVQPLLELSERVRTTYMEGIQAAFDANGTVPEKLNGMDPAKIGRGGEYEPVKVLAMSSEIFRAMAQWQPYDSADCLPVGAHAA